MPVYEYQCKDCSRDFEYQQRMADPDKTTCEVCGGTLERLISRTAFSLKGGGWYKDLYASPKPEKADTTKPEKTDGAAASAEKPAATSDAGSGTTKSSDGSGTTKSSDGGGTTSSGSGSTTPAAAAKEP